MTMINILRILIEKMKHGKSDDKHKHRDKK